MHNVYYKHLILGDAQVSARRAKVLFFFFFYIKTLGQLILMKQCIFCLPHTQSSSKLVPCIRYAWISCSACMFYCGGWYDIVAHAGIWNTYNIFASSTENSINIIIKTVALLPLVYVILGCVSWSRHHRPGAPQCWTDDLRGECVNNGQSSRWNVNWKYKINRAAAKELFILL